MRSSSTSGAAEAVRRATVLVLLLAATAAAATDPNDPLYSLQWGPVQIRASDAWDTSTGAGIVIAIIDSGVALTHPDLTAQLVPGATFFGCPTSASCGTGHWLDSQGPSLPSPHGTHVSGIAAAATDNSVGIAGVARDAKIMPVKVLDEDGGTTSDIAAGIDWARENGAHVINMSLGGIPGAQGFSIVGSFDPMNAAVDRAIAAGMVVVAAAGNDAASACSAPAFHPDVLCVVATDPNENRAPYSNFALGQGLNAVSAPGGAGLVFCADDIVSTVPNNVSNCGLPNRYSYLAGTSMASPHVAGVAALLLAQGRTAANVYDALRDTARTPVTGERGTYDPTFGYGIVDADEAVQYMPEPGGVWLLLVGAWALSRSPRLRRR